MSDFGIEYEKNNVRLASRLRKKISKFTQSLLTFMVSVTVVENAGSFAAESL